MDSLPVLEPTHPGGVVDEHATSKGWRLGVAASWRALEHHGCAACRRLVAELGNAGPPERLGRTVD